MVLPEHIPLTIAWILGVMVDVLHANYLGESSLAFCLVAFFSYRFHLQFRMFPLTQQVFLVFIVLSIYEGLLAWVQSSLGLSVNFRWIWCSLLASALMWPLFCFFLKIHPSDR